MDKIIYLQFLLLYIFFLWSVLLYSHHMVDYIFFYKNDLMFMSVTWRNTFDGLKNVTVDCIFGVYG